MKGKNQSKPKHLLALLILFVCLTKDVYSKSFNDAKFRKLLSSKTEQVPKQQTCRFENSDKQCARFACDTLCANDKDEMFGCNWKRKKSNVGAPLIAKDCMVLLKVQQFWRLFSKNEQWTDELLSGDFPKVGVSCDPSDDISKFFPELKKSNGKELKVTELQNVYKEVSAQALAITRALIAAMKIKENNGEKLSSTENIKATINAFAQSKDQGTRTGQLAILDEFIGTETKKNNFDRVIRDSNKCENLFVQDAQYHVSLDTVPTHEVVWLKQNEDLFEY